MPTPPWFAPQEPEPMIVVDEIDEPRFIDPERMAAFTSKWLGDPRGWSLKEPAAAFVPPYLAFRECGP